MVLQKLGVRTKQNKYQIVQCKQVGREQHKNINWSYRNRTISTGVVDHSQRQMVLYKLWVWATQNKHQMAVFKQWAYGQPTKPAEGNKHHIVRARMAKHLQLYELTRHPCRSKNESSLPLSSPTRH